MAHNSHRMNLNVSSLPFDETLVDFLFYFFHAVNLHNKDIVEADGKWKYRDFHMQKYHQRYSKRHSACERKVD